MTRNRSDTGAAMSKDNCPGDKSLEYSDRYMERYDAEYR